MPRVPIIPLITFAFRAGPSKRRRRSWASHSTWTTPPPAGRLQHIPAHAVGPAFWGGEGREWCLSKNEQSEGVFLDSWFSSCCCRVSGCRRLFDSSTRIASAIPSRPHTAYHHRLLGCRCRLSVLLVSLLTLQPSPLAAARPSIARIARIARIASQRPVHASSALACQPEAREPARKQSKHHYNGVQTRLSQHYSSSISSTLRQPSLPACCLPAYCNCCYRCSSCCSQARGA